MSGAGGEIFPPEKIPFPARTNSGFGQSKSSEEIPVNLQTSNHARHRALLDSAGLLRQGFTMPLHIRHAHGFYALTLNPFSLGVVA